AVDRRTVPAAPHPGRCGGGGRGGCLVGSRGDAAGVGYRGQQRRGALVARFVRGGERPPVARGRLGSWRVPARGGGRRPDERPAPDPARRLAASPDFRWADRRRAGPRLRRGGARPAPAAGAAVVAGRGRGGGRRLLRAVLAPAPALRSRRPRLRGCAPGGPDRGGHGRGYRARPLHRRAPGRLPGAPPPAPRPRRTPGPLPIRQLPRRRRHPYPAAAL
ncbi:MAG: Phosphoenolpyruvate synthase, partial [uncultured Thermomicrobiales bacterium]